MTTLTAPTAQKRCRKTRTRTVSSRPPLLLSSLPLNLIELSPGKEHLVCPDCTTWCPVTGVQSTPKLVPHHTERTGSPEPRRCSGSNRRVVLDLTEEHWLRLRADAVKATASRRPTRVLRKPKVAVAAPVHRLLVQAPTVGSARAAYLGHRARCNGCTTKVTCLDGRRLAAVYADLLSRDPQYSEQLAAVERERQEFEQRRADLARQSRLLHWQNVLPAVEATDTQRKALPQGSTVLMPIKGAGMPLGTPTTATNIDQKRQKKS